MSRKRGKTRREKRRGEESMIRRRKRIGKEMRENEKQEEAKR